MTVSKGSAVNNEIPITLTIAAGGDPGSAGQLSGTLSVPGDCAGSHHAAGSTGAR